MPDKFSITELQRVTGIADLVSSKSLLAGIAGADLVATAPAPPVMVVRSEDFLFLTFLFSGLGLQDKTKKKPMLVRTSPEALIAVAFPQQSIGEQAFYQLEPAGGFTPNPPSTVKNSEAPKFPALSRLSGISWLTFRIPATIDSIPYSLEALLEWQKWELVTTPPAGVPKNGALASAIEAPFRLVLSPEPDAVWEHEQTAIDREGSIELWHTRLVPPSGRFRVSGRTSAPTVPSVRVAWARDFDLGGKTFQNPFRSSLTPSQRTELVLLSSTKTGKTPSMAKFTPTPITAHKLMLTPLGAYLDLQGTWDDAYREKLGKVLDDQKASSGLSISEWRHLATLGRDHYVRVVEEGVLFPFGHRAALITITERRFEGRLGSSSTAVLLQQMFVVVREPVKEMRAAGVSVPNGDLVDSLLPFNRVRVMNSSTPVIDPPGNSPSASISNLGQKAFWVTVSGQDFRFNLIGDDWEDRPCEFDLPLIFVSNASIKQPEDLSKVFDAYDHHLLVSVSDSESLLERRSGQTFGRMVAFAEASNPGDTSYETRQLTFEARRTKSPDVQPFRPGLTLADVRISAVEQLAGGAETVSQIAYAAPYRSFGLVGKKNKSEIFAELVGLAPALDFSKQAQRSGGLATPSLMVGGLSRRLGAVGDANLQGLAEGKFNPAAFFNISAKILGGISLSEVLAAMVPTTFDANRLPKVSTNPVYASDGQTPIALETTLDWKPLLKGDHPILQFKNPSDGLTVSIKMRASLQGDEQSSINGELKSFSLVFANAIEVAFKSLSFRQPAGEKLEVDAKLAKPCVVFRGPLAFLNPLAELVDSVGFSDPPSLDITATGVQVGYSLGLPPLTIGAYALQNVTLGAALNIPFTGEAIRVRFNFCERHNPFLLTVNGFAGGGFVALALGADGIEGIEAALEFGGNLALNLGVASGGVSVMGGFYFGSAQNSLTFSAYVRANGVLEVLSLIAISTEFYLELSYSKVNKKGRFSGRASLTVEVEVAFFSKSVSMTVEREFAGGDNDPTFQQLISKPNYKIYREAFAN